MADQFIYFLMKETERQANSKFIQSQICLERERRISEIETDGKIYLIKKNNPIFLKRKNKKEK